MSAARLDVFNKTFQSTNIWLNEICSMIGPDRKVAWKVLSVVLHKLRERLPVELAAHLGAELPLLIRGVYYDQFEPEKQPTKWELDEFIAEVAISLSDTRPVNTRLAMQAVFTQLSRHLPHGQIVKVQAALPSDLRRFWISAEESMRAAAGS
jgi:uncharacterized protein (DUF2267 family)